MSLLRTLSSYLRPPDPRSVRQIDVEILDELEFHIEMRARDNERAGMPPDEARADALKRFGNVQRIQNARRPVGSAPSPSLPNARVTTNASRRSVMNRSARVCCGLLAVVAFHCSVRSATAIDLGERYPATLDYSQEPRGYDWTCEEGDVWRLTGFSFFLGDEYRIALGPSQVVFGCHGSNVVWAALFPDKPGELAAADDGQGEHVTSAWLRFHPTRVGELFPAATVSGQGDPAMRLEARRLAAHKMRCCWHASSLPMIPLKISVTIDVETREGPRRFHSIDTDAKTVQYVDAFRLRSLPRPAPIDRDRAMEAFDALWNAFDREYAMFVIKPKVDWAALRDTYRPRAETVEDDYHLGVVLAEMLAQLEDLHVYVKVGGEYVPGYNRDRPLNGSWSAASHLIGPVSDTGHDLAWARTGDRIGYINIYRLADPRLPQAFDEALAKMDDTKGLILDLRFNGGGSEPLGMEIAGRLLERPCVYSLSQYRNGPKHADLGVKNPRSCGPSGPWHYSGPVIVLVGQRTMSSAESFALMLAQCPQVTTMGDRTAGSSGNPRQIEVAGRITVNLPRWLDMDPDGKPIDAVGISPEVRIEAKPEDFSEQSDPVLAAALKDLRSRRDGGQAAGAAVLTRRPGVKPSAPSLEEDTADRPKVVSVSPPDGATDVEPITEIRVRFDRPMSPRSALLVWDRAGTSGFRLHGEMQYDGETKEFVVPVVLTPGTTHRLKVNELFSSLPPEGFRSSEGVAAAPHSWQFATRDIAADPKAAVPRLVSVDPPSGSKTSVFAPIRLRFDRPMSPDRYEVIDATTHTPGATGLSVHFPVSYDAESNSFVIPALLPPDKTCRIELCGLWSAEGGRAEPIRLQYEVGGKLYSAAQRARIAEAARSEALHKVVEAARQARLGITSLEETVQTVYAYGAGPTWTNSFRSQGATFRFQGRRQLFADVSDIMRTPFVVGSDGRQCWNRGGDALVACPFDAVDDKNVLFCDPFGSTRFATAEETIDQMKLEYLGSEEYEGRTCHRVRSWKGEIGRFGNMGMWWVTGLLDWLVDAETHLPVVVEQAAFRSRYSYWRINEPMADADFQPPSDDGKIAPKPVEPLGDGFDRRFLNARDGSDGRMSVRWGKTGAKGGRSSSGLN